MHPQSRILFQKFSPYSTMLMKEPSTKNLVNFREQLQQFQSKSDDCLNPLNSLVEYLSFPLIMMTQTDSGMVSKPPNNERMEEIFTCLNILLKDSHDLNWMFLNDVFARIFICLSCKTDPQNVADYVETCVEKGLNCVISLCNGLKSSDLKLYCSPSFKPKLGHGLFICLKILETSKAINVKIMAIEAIKAMGLYHKKLLTKEEMELIGVNLIYFLPGVSISMSKLATTRSIQNHKILVAALECWTYYVTTSMNDVFLSLYIKNLGENPVMVSLTQKLFPKENKISDTDDQPKENRDLKEDTNTQLPPVNINEKWLENTRSKLGTLIGPMKAIVLHSHWKVRLTLAKMCESLLSHCRMSLNSCLLDLIEILIVLKNDPSSEISSFSNNVISSLEKNPGRGYDFLLDTVKDRTLNYIMKMTAIARSEEDSKLLESVQQVLGSFQILGSELSQFLSVPPRLEKLIFSLSQILCLSNADPDLMNETLTKTNCCASVVIKPGINRSFVYFNDMRILEATKQLCFHVVRNCDLMLLADKMLCQLTQNYAMQKDMSLLCLFFVEGLTCVSGLDQRKKSAFTTSILDTVIVNDFLNVSITLKETELNKCVADSKTSVVRNNILFLTNILDTIGCCSQIMGINFKPFLNSILYSVMEKAGNPNTLVSYASVEALKKIALACDYAGVPDLIEKSVPFFWFNLSQRLKRIPEFPNAPYVLTFALQTKYDEVQAYVEDLVEDILDSLDTFYSEMSIPLLQVLLIFTNSLTDRLPIDNKLPNREVPSSFWDKLVKRDKHYRDSIDVEKVIKLDRPLTEKDFSAEKLDENPSDTKINVPRHVTLVSSIIERCSYLLSVEDRKIRLLCLEIARSCVNVLLNYEDTKLPAYHKIWKPLVYCLKGNDWVVWMKCLETSVIMLESSGDFLKKRFMDEFFPPLLEFLWNHSSACCNKLPTDFYFTSPVFKAQILILEKLEIILKCLDLNTELTTKLLETVVLYAYNEQPIIVVEKALNVFNFFARHHTEILWLGLSILLKKQPVEQQNDSKFMQKNHSEVPLLHSSILILYDSL